MNYEENSEIFSKIFLGKKSNGGLDSLVYVNIPVTSKNQFITERLQLVGGTFWRYRNEICKLTVASKIGLTCMCDGLFVCSEECILHYRITDATK